MRVPNLVASEKDLKGVLDTLFHASKEGKSFTGLLELAMNDQTIITAVHNIKSNKGSKTAGIDKKTVDHYLQMPFKKLIGLVKGCFTNYNPKPVRRHFIEKQNGKLRPLGIPVVIDRIIQECIRIVIEPIAEARFFEHSYGFRPYRATKHAIRSVTYHADRTPWVIEGDIKGYFDNIHHGLLIKKLWNIGIIDKRILAIIKKMLKAGVLDRGNLKHSEKGTPQGGILSPLLANIYLNDFDWMIARRWQIPSRENEYSKRYAARNYLKRAGFGECFLTRYADDWVIQVPTEKDAVKLLRELKRYFSSKLKLELSDEKTVITDMRKNPIKFLGFNLIAEPIKAKHGKPSSGRIVGKNYPNPQKVREQIKSLSSAIHNLSRRTTHEEWAAEIERINAIIVGYAEYWKTGTSKRTLTKLDNAVHHIARAVFRRKWGGVGLKAYHIPLSKLNNRPLRHAGRADSTWAVPIGDLWVGLTKAQITAIQYQRFMFNQDMTPYTPEGRKQYAEQTKRKLPLDRPPLYSTEFLWSKVGVKGIYNFEFMMNREYAYNRDKGRCKCCDAPLVEVHSQCHHKRPWLPLDRVNKVQELIWVCTECHAWIHNIGLPDNPKATNKIIKLRSLLKPQQERAKS
ncbi:group II intron reverse transcriptase/maturase [Paenibacillus sp. FSL K6-2859]|uniref:group II intron reverse transcriptase/maturase n=1 Tax=Paenibacillus sp. FSL K6-2859 TaxID=2921482 RepID=UPI0030FCA346